MSSSKTSKRISRPAQQIAFCSTTVPSKTSRSRKASTWSRDKLKTSGEDGQPYNTPCQIGKAADNADSHRTHAYTSEYIQHSTVTTPANTPNSSVKARYSLVRSTQS